MDAQKVGKRIQEARLLRGMTQAALAEKVGLSVKYISNIECGFKTPKLSTFVDLANALECDADSLLCDVLDSATVQQSGSVSERLLTLPMDEQRRILQLVDVMIEQASGK